MTADLAVVGMDPAFGDGARAHVDAFLEAARDLGREPELHYGRMPSGLRRFDAANQLAAAARIARRVGDARSVWVVATAASYGLGAALSGRPYACWLGNGMEDEWAGRREGLPRSRRVALAVNAPILRRIERRVLRGATRVYGTSPWSRRKLEEAGGLPPGSVGRLPLPVDVDAITPASDDEWRATLEAPVAVFVGRASDPRKNVRLLLDAASLLPNVRVLLVGAPPAGGLPANVEAAGVVPDVAPLLRRGSLFVLPSRQEGFGIAAAEAMAAGLPVVTTPCGGPEGLVADSGAGVVLGGFSPRELADAVASLLADRERLAEMRGRAREHVVREHSPGRLRELLAEALTADERATA